MPQADGAPSAEAGGPIALDALAYGIDHLEAILVVYLGDAHVHAAWVRPDAGFGAQEIAARMRDAYRACQGSVRGIELLAGGEASGALSDPTVVLETASRTILFRRIRAYVIAVLFDAAMPLGMARLIAAKIGARLDPELPFPSGNAGESMPPPNDRPFGELRPSLPPIDTDVKTLAFPPGMGLPHMQRSSRPPLPRATLTDLDRAKRLLSFLESRCPEPHVARLRVALRAGLTPLALEHPEALRADAMILIETAVEDILGVEQSELRRLV